MSRLTRTVAPTLVTAVLALASTAGAAASAQGTPSLWFAPTHGNDSSAVTVVTSGSCTRGTNLIGRIYGPGFPASGQIAVSNSPTSAYDRTKGGGYVVPLGATVRDLLSMQPRQTIAHGDYRVVIACRDAVRRNEYATFSGVLHFGSAAQFFAPPAPKTATEIAPADPTGSTGAAPQPGGAGPATSVLPSSAPVGSSGGSPQRRVGLPAASTAKQSDRGALPALALVFGAVAVLGGLGLVVARRLKPSNGAQT